jgi:hypothetical protein
MVDPSSSIKFPLCDSSCLITSDSVVPLPVAFDLRAEVGVYLWYTGGCENRLELGRGIAVDDIAVNKPP